MLWLKRLSVVIGALLVLLIAVLAYVMFFVNSDSFKTELQKVALEKAGIHLRIDGDIQWTFFPWLGLELDDIGVAMGKDPEILQFDRAEFGLAILPLLKHTIQVDRVRLVNLQASLKVDSSGRGNWQRSPDAEATSSTASGSSNSNNTASASNSSSTANSYQATSSGADIKAIPDLQLDSLKIDNAKVTYIDEQTQQKIEANFNVNLSNVQWDKAWPMMLDAVIKQSDLAGNNTLTVASKLNADLTVFPSREAFSLENASLVTELSGDSLPVSPLKAELALKQMDMDVPQENLFMEGIAVNALGVNATGKAQLYQVLSNPQYSASLSVSEFNPRNLLQQLNIPLPAMADSTALTKASAKVKIEGGRNELVIQPLSLVMDDTNLQANIVTELSPLRWDVNIQGDSLDLDRYLPPEATDEGSAASEKQASTETASSNTQKAASSTDEELVPLELVRSLYGHIGFVFDNLTVKKLQLDSVKLDATLANGLVNVSPAAVDLYQGNATLKATYDARTSNPKLTMSTQVKGIEIQPLLKDFMELDKLSGTTSLTGELSAQGNQIDVLKANLNGDFLAQINDGALVGMNLTKTVCQGIAAVRKETVNSSDFSDNTPFETMDFPIHIVNGKVSTPGLTMTSVGLSVTGDGIVSLPNNSLDYRVKVAVAGSELDHACRVNEKVAKLAFPVICKGQFSDDPASLCRPDIKGFGDVFADLAKAELQDKLDAEKERFEEKKDAEIERAKEKLQDKLQDKLKSLF